jgi:hypothetical protein
MKGRKMYEDYTTKEKFMLNIVYYVGLVYMLLENFKKRSLR